ncbi:MAG: hypothetical protein IKS90_06885 [Clostridia bacterium]|nr:hypothetical protein [Clostridia bacterium]
MKFIKLFKAKKKQKKKEEATRAFDLANYGNTVNTFTVDPSDIDPPKTRYTEEYQEFVENMEATIKERKTAEAEIE